MFSKIDKRNWAFIFAYLSMFVLGMADNIRGPLFPELISFFKLTNTEGSLSFAAASAAALAGNIASAALLKKMNLAQVLSLSLFLMAVGLFLMGIAPQFNFFIGAAIIFGASLGLMGVIQNLMVAENVGSVSQSKALSGLHGIYGLSSLIAPLIASYAPAVFGNWRAAFFITALITLVFGFASVIIGSQPRFEVHVVDKTTVKSKNSFWALLFFGGIFAFYVVSEIMLSTRLALYMRTYFSMDLESSSKYVTYFFVFLLLGRIIFAFKSFSASLKTQLNGSLVLSLILFILGMCFHPLFFVLMGLSMAPFYPLSVAYISEQTGIHRRQFITFALSFQSICVISMHLGVGYLTDQFGLFYAFGVGFISLLLSLVCVNFHPKALSS